MGWPCDDRASACGACGVWGVWGVGRAGCRPCSELHLESRTGLAGHGEWAAATQSSGPLSCPEKQVVLQSEMGLFPGAGK